MPGRSETPSRYEFCSGAPPISGRTPRFARQTLWHKSPMEGRELMKGKRKPPRRVGAPSEEEAFRAALRGYRLYESLARKVHARWGKEGLRVINEVTREFAEAGAKALEQKASQGPAALVKEYLRVGQAITGPVEIVDEGEDFIRYRNYTCPYRLRHGERALCPALDRAGSTMRRLGFRFTTPATRVREETDYCEHIVEVKGRRRSGSE